MSIESMPSPLGQRSVSGRSPAMPARLQSVQMLRGLAALLVVLFHAAAIWREHSGATGFMGPWDRGWAGVDLFFVISGFVMVWVAGERPAGARGAGRFVLDRATRIYPLWWVFCALMGLYFVVAYGQPASPEKVGANGAWRVFAQSMMLWPIGQQPVLGVGWTLTFELAFYAVFAGLLLLPRSWRLPLLGLWAAGLIVAIVVLPPAPNLPDSWLGILLNPLCLEFVFGAGVAALLRRWTPPKGVSVCLTVIGVAAFLVVATWPDAFGSVQTVLGRVLFFGTASAIVLAGVVGWERASDIWRGSPLSAAWIRLGDASYTLYLSHFIVLLVFKRLAASVGLLDAPTALSMAAFMLLGTAISVAASLILYPWLERPLLKLARAPLAKQPAKRQS